MVYFEHVGNSVELKFLWQNLVTVDQTVTRGLCVCCGRDVATVVCCSWLSIDSFV